MPRNRFSPEALEPFIEEALAAEAGDPMALSFEEPAPAPARQPTFRKYGLPAWAVGTGMDLLGTHQALSNGNGREANPLFSRMGPNTLVATNALISALMAYGMDRIAKKSPSADKGMTIAGLVGGGARGAIGVNNLRIAKGAR